MDEKSLFQLLAQTLFGSYTSLLPMVNPFSTVPLLLALTARMPVREQRRQGDLAARNAVIIMLVGLFLGSLIMQFFNISVPALRIAGGLIISVIGLNMLFPKSHGKEGDLGEATGADSSARLDYSVVPLALPSMSGAGTLALIMAYSAQVISLPSWPERIVGYGAVSVAILLMGVTCFFVLRSARWIQGYLGPQGINAMSRVMGLIMVCIGIQFIADGVMAFVRAAAAAG
jgi:multiple antibiotic resistance protein